MYEQSSCPTSDRYISVSTLDGWVSFGVALSPFRLAERIASPFIHFWPSLLVACDRVHRCPPVRLLMWFAVLASRIEEKGIGDGNDCYVAVFVLSLYRLFPFFYCAIHWYKEEVVRVVVMAAAVLQMSLLSTICSIPYQLGHVIINLVWAWFHIQAKQFLSTLYVIKYCSYQPVQNFQSRAHTIKITLLETA